jgi:anti-sigma B factor antagonist
VLRGELDEHLPTVPLVVLDLSQVTFLGSAGLAVLVAAKDDAERRGHRLRLVCGSRIVTRALEATGLLALFDVADGVPEALRPTA